MGKFYWINWWIAKNNLGGYFLIVQDYIQFAHSRDICVGPGRGSSAGSLVAYLLGITKIDPIPYGLIFERFYNEGRNTPGNIELPDIDTDFDKMRRGEVINYVKNKYGHDRVGHIVTLSSLQGRGALKEILRVYNACSHLEMSEITKQIPQEAEISDLLEDMRKQKGYSSILEWTLENEPELVSQYCRLEDGKLVGDYARYFELAIKIEGVKKNTGQHASGIVISSEPLEDVVPLHNQGGELIIGLEMDSAKKFGLVKFDILGLKGLSCISDATRLINEELSLCG
jgi:DNA polymerase-3 subunit alpha